MRRLLVTLSGNEYSIDLSRSREYAHHTTHRVATAVATSLFIVVIACVFLGIGEFGASSQILNAPGLTRVILGLAGLTGFFALAISFQSRHKPEGIIKPKDAAHSITNAAWRVIEQMQMASTTEAAILAIIDNPISRLTIARVEVNPEELHSLAHTLPASASLPSRDWLIEALIKQSFAYAVDQSSYQVDVEHLLISLLSIDNPDIQPLNNLLTQAHTSLKQLIEVSAWYALAETSLNQSRRLSDESSLRPKNTMNRAWTARQTPITDRFSTDLSLMASYGSIRTLLSYKKEVDQAIRALESDHRIPLFVAEQGSGIEDISATVASALVGDPKQQLHDYRVLLVDLAPILSSPNPEQLLDAILDEARLAANVILSIENLSALATGRSFDPASVLASAISSGNLKIFATSNHSDQRRFVDNASQLRGLFMPIQLHELTRDETIQELKQRTPQLEHQKDCVITLPALYHAVSLTETISVSEPNPARTMHLLEEAASQVHAANKHFVTVEAVTHATEQLTGIKSATATGDEAAKLLKLESLLQNQVIGQPQAVRAVAEAIKRARAGLADPNRPLASFLFAGPTGVGKTELAKSLARSYIGSEEALLRFDMSEYQTTDGVDRLIGSADDPKPQGGLLTQAIKQAPFRIILFDEIEKAHPGVLDLFLQLLDDARITENTGQTIRLTNAILIATTNVAGREIYAKGGVLETTELNKLLETVFRPEFLNRFDAIVPFNPLSGGILLDLVKSEVKKVAARAEKKGITLTITDDALQALAEIGTDERYGARPLRRTVEQKLENLLADALLSGTTANGTAIEVTREMLQ